MEEMTKEKKSPDDSVVPTVSEAESVVRILVVNSGSSSLKCSLFVFGEGESEGERLAHCEVERVGSEEAALSLETASGTEEKDCHAPDHSRALGAALEMLTSEQAGVLSSLESIDAVGHRVVHGGEDFSESVALDSEVISAIEANVHLAPLHNPPNLEGIRASTERLPEAIQVGVFDTAFHQTMPMESYLYAIPHDLYEREGIRRYGFHGTSHDFVSRRAAQLLGMNREECNLITLHLGNGCSATAVEGGRSIDTSMGLTPLEGLVMGTRSGDIDPSLPFLLTENLGMSSSEVYELLNRRSGLEGLSGVSNDMREVTEAAEEGNSRARQAVDVFCHRARKYIGAYWLVLGRVDAVVFTAGIGENSPEVRRRICGGLKHMGLEIDDRKNRETVGDRGVISTEDSDVKALVIPTDEERQIARDTYEIYCVQTKDNVC